MFLKGVLIRNLFFCNGSNPAHLKTLMERNYQVAEKEEDDLHKHRVATRPGNPGNVLGVLFCPENVLKDDPHF